MPPLPDFDLVRRLAGERFQVPEPTLHGPDHWSRVEERGLLIAGANGGDAVVVRLFALFHDCCRLTDGPDPGHGARGAGFAAGLRGRAFDLDERRFALLAEACSRHTDGQVHGDPTIGACWDADRLDIGRAGHVPDPAYMSTACGRELAALARAPAPSGAGGARTGPPRRRGPPPRRAPRP